MKLSDSQEKAYVESGGYYCPNPDCENEDITADGVDQSEGGGVATCCVSCNDCGASWTEVWNIVGVSDLRVPDDEEEAEEDE